VTAPPGSEIERYFLIAGQLTITACELTMWCVLKGEKFLRLSVLPT